jgi:hypothetical protein
VKGRNVLVPRARLLLNTISGDSTSAPYLRHLGIHHLDVDGIAKEGKLFRVHSCMIHFAEARVPGADVSRRRVAVQRPCFG